MPLNPTDLIQKLWNDPSDFEKFMSDPKTYLIEQGEQLPDNLTVKAYADTPSQRHYVLPAKESQIPQGDDPVLTIMRGALADPTSKAQLLKDPKAVASEMGINIPDGVAIHILENTPDEVNLTVPVNPANAEFSDADLELIAGGKLSQGAQCGIGAGSTAAACGTAAVTAAVFAFTVVTIVTAGVAGGTSAVAAGGTTIGSAAASG
ncbi:MAG TPA: NHLP leader peptide family RiPP precursor [Nodularia sp. (in: cyanobacteria)]|nr:NHLP leader peptide family RiPP precursor [Nodularia sp. (in: cyanobacteria)]